MTEGLGTMLREVAEGAHNYADSRKAVGDARRSRRLRAGAVAAVALAVLVGSVFVWDRGEPLPPAQPPERSHPVYPPVISPPADAELLPEDEAVGIASFLYSACLEVAKCPEFLVMPDGRQYRMPAVADRIHATGKYSLSPDGRYVSWDAGEVYRIRDLQGIQIIDVEVPGRGRELSAAGWSPNSRYLLVVRHEDQPRSYVRVDLEGSSGPVLIPHDDSPVETREEIVGVLDSGELILLTHNGVNPFTRLRVVESATLRESRVVPVNASGIMSMTQDGESVWEPIMSPGSNVIGFTVWARADNIDKKVAPVAHGRQAGLLEVDLTQGHAIGRLNNPAPQVERQKYTSLWAIKANLTGGYVALHWTAESVEIVLVDPKGHRNVVTRLPAGAVVLVRSATTAYY